MATNLSTSSSEPHSHAPPPPHGWPWCDDPAKLGLSLDEGQRTQRVVHKLGLLLFAPFDVAEQWFTTHVQQVSEHKNSRPMAPNAPPASKSMLPHKIPSGPCASSPPTPS